MNRPLIGISGSHNVADRQMFVRENYMQSVLRAGGIPVLLPEIEDEETAKAILDRLDGLLLAGGGDVLPSRYGEETLPACGEDDPQRDIFELLIIPMAIARNIPIFGICRGIQVLNVAMGGTLIQDIESQQNIPKKTHQQEPPFSQPVHTVRFEKGSVFERITGATEIKANSMHHQAIKKPADGLQVDGRAEDGIIEAMSAKDGSRIFAVQFHPEYLSDHDAHAQRLFDHFVKLSREVFLTRFNTLLGKTGLAAYRFRRIEVPMYFCYNERAYFSNLSEKETAYEKAPLCSAVRASYPDYSRRFPRVSRYAVEHPGLSAPFAG